MNYFASWPIKTYLSFKKIYQGHFTFAFSQLYFFSLTPLNLLCLATLLGLLYFSYFGLQEIYNYYLRTRLFSK